MRYSTKIDGRTYAIDRADDELLMLDRVARKLAILIAQKIYGKRQGAVCSIAEARTGRRVDTHPRYWTFEAVIGRQDKMGRTIEWQEIPFQILELPLKPPRQLKRKAVVPTEPKTLAEILDF